MGGYVSEQVHINGIESFLALLKTEIVARGMMGKTLPYKELIAGA